jgi:hypothetical protein
MFFRAHKHKEIADAVLTQVQPLLNLLDRFSGSVPAGLTSGADSAAKAQLYLLPRATKIEPSGPLAAMISAHSDFADSESGNGASHGPNPRFQACLEPSWLPF